MQSPRPLWDYAFGESSTFAWNVAPGLVWDSAAADIGIVSQRRSGTRSALSITDLNTPRVGHVAPMFAADFYERIHIYPLSIALGNLIGAQSRPVTLWNAFTRSRIIQTLTILEGGGLALTGQPDPTLAMAPLQLLVWDLDISEDGPPTIDATLQWGFDLGQVITVPVTGGRVTAWSWAPDWSRPIVERLSWGTDVIEAYGAEEQRRSWRTRPRRAFEFDAFARGRDRALLESILFAWGARVWALPIWPDGVDAGSNMPPGTLSFACDTAGRDFAVGGLALFLGATARDVEVAEVALVAPSLVTLRNPITGSWPAGTRIYPARTALITGEPSMERFTGDDAGSGWNFELMENAEYAEDDGAAAYRGYPVMETPSNWSSEPSTGYSRKLAKVSSGIGAPFLDDEANLPWLRQTSLWTLTTKAAQGQWRSLLHALKGRRGAIWMPLAGRDVTPVAFIGAASANLDVEFAAYGSFVNLAVNRRDLRIELASGAIFYRRIVSTVLIDEDTERLVLDAPFGLDLAPGDFAAVQFMALMRNVADAVELAYWSGDVADCKAVFRSFTHDV